MNNLFTKLAESSNAIVQTADTLLNRIVPQETASAACTSRGCTPCVFGRKVCTRLCCSIFSFPPCRTSTRIVRC